ncbi:MAG TPA: ATP-binding cassette domain-containing protein [Patescibacteria group bacterium]|nr:ATP-binding cassette domain-containing protein [Patescibacteria group bacterium]
MDNANAIEVLHLSKNFDKLTAVDEITFEVRSGEIFSLLGPNGAGKSTTISMLSCLLRPSSGDAKVMGHSIIKDPKGVKASIGVVPQDIALYEDLSARENLIFWGRMYGLSGQLLKERVDGVLQLIGLEDRQKGRVGKFSGGMKRRVNIGVAMLHRPQVIIMDEPTVGIDPQSRRHILDGIITLNQAGVTVLYTTHYMEEAQELSDHIAIMDHGKLIAYGNHDELVQIVGEQDRIDLSLSEPAGLLADQWRQIEGVQQVTSEGENACMLVEDSNKILPIMFEKAAKANVRITSVKIQEPNLETVFLHLTGRALRD